MTPEQRKNLLTSLNYALRSKCRGLKWKRHDDDGPAIAAWAILEHLELCGYKIEEGRFDRYHGEQLRTDRTGPRDGEAQE